MDLKEHLAIFRKHKSLFGFAVILVLAGGIIFQLFRPLTYRSDLMLNVTRIGSQSTSAYTYDGFYRLQADERFADTVVRWLGAPRVIKDILAEAGMTEKDLVSLNPRRLSSQMIAVSFMARDKEKSKKLIDAMIKIINKQTDDLNVSQKEINWFKILGSEPVTVENIFPWNKVIIVSLLVGIMAGVWMVYLKNYFN